MDFPLIVGSILSLALLSPNANAGPMLTYAGKTVRWNLNPSSAALAVYIDPSASAITSTINEALNEWSAVSGSFLKLTTTGTQSSAQIEISVGSLSNSYSSGGASPSYSTDTGEIQSCPIIFGSVVLTATSDVARTLILHEVGHCLGLMHSTVRNAVMSYRDGASHLTDDDRLSLIRLYPSDESQDLPLGCATVSRPPYDSGRGLLFPNGLAHFLGVAFLLCFAWWQTHPVRSRATP